MRKILFRGKSVETGAWKLGQFCPDVMEILYGIKINGIPTNGFIRSYNEQINRMVMNEVDRETVGQFTGAIDKNGKEIFEGDIICFDKELKAYGIVRFGDYLENEPIDKMENRELGFYVEHLYYKREFKRLLYWTADFEVIGNIHDNPELVDCNKTQF